MVPLRSFHIHGTLEKESLKCFSHYKKGIVKSFFIEVINGSSVISLQKTPSWNFYSLEFVISVIVMTHIILKGEWYVDSPGWVCILVFVQTHRLRPRNECLMFRYPIANLEFLSFGIMGVLSWLDLANLLNMLVMSRAL